MILYTRLRCDGCIKPKKVKIEQFWGEQEPFQIGVFALVLNVIKTPWCYEGRSLGGKRRVWMNHFKVKFSHIQASPIYFFLFWSLHYFRFVLGGNLQFKISEWTNYYVKMPKKLSKPCAAPKQVYGLHSVTNFSV